MTYQILSKLSDKNPWQVYVPWLNSKRVNMWSVYLHSDSTDAYALNSQYIM